MLGGKRYSYDNDDYIIAALNIFLDIINIFLILLELLGLGKSLKWFISFCFFLKFDFIFDRSYQYFVAFLIGIVK